MHVDLLPEELMLTEQDVVSSSQTGLVRRRPQEPLTKERIDYEALQQICAWITLLQ
jgi:hypothetical protein